jgi:type II secretory pathway component PulK
VPLPTRRYPGPTSNRLFTRAAQKLPASIAHAPLPTRRYPRPASNRLFTRAAQKLLGSIAHAQVPTRRYMPANSNRLFTRALHQLPASIAHAPLPTRHYRHATTEPRPSGSGLPPAGIAHAQLPVRKRGSALLAVLWLSAALAAISFSVAMTVRGETERVATSEEDVRSYYLAQGAIQRAILYVQWSDSNHSPDGSSPYFVTGQPRMNLQFPTGNAVVEIIPETSKLSLNLARPGVLGALLVNLGASPDQAATIAAGILDWRTPHPATELTDFDQLYLSMQPSFRSAHASFQDVEDLLYIYGMTPDLFYGSWVRQGEGAESRLVPREGLRDCVSPFGSTDRFDVNTVRPAVLAAVGVAPEDIQALMNRRRLEPFYRQQDMTDFAQGSPNLLNHITMGTHTLYTFRATAQLRRPDGSLSDLKRVVSATVKLLPAGSTIVGDTLSQSFHILRWYDRG